MGLLKNDKGQLVDPPLSEWFELSYAQFLTIPRLVMENMPLEWQEKMKALLYELDGTFDWRPEEGRYWVRLKDNSGRFCDAPLSDYRRGTVEHIRRNGHGLINNFTEQKGGE